MSGTNILNPAQPVFGGNPPPQTIRCTPENAAEFQRLVKNDPDLLALVQNLQAQNLFPGLRGMSITLTGPKEQRALGLSAWAAEKPATSPASAATAPATARP